MSHLNLFRDGMGAYRAGDYDAAVKALGPLAERDDVPGRMARYYCAMAHRSMGIEDIAAGRFDQAADHLRQAVALIGNRAELAEYLLLAYAGAGRYDRCAVEADVLCRTRPDDAGARVCLAQLQWRSGRREEAVMTLTRALRELGDIAELHLNLGLFHAAEEKFEPARRHLARAVECDCTSLPALRYLGLLESARGDFREAVRAFQRALALDPGDLLITYRLCLVAEAASPAGRPVIVSLPEPAACRCSSEIRRLAEFVVTETDFVEAFLALPASDMDEQLFGVLLSVLRAALAMHDDYADVHYLAAAVLLRLGDLQAARRHAERALGINPRYVKAMLLVADLDARCGLAAQAAASLQQAVAAGADWPDVHARLGDLLKENGKPALARHHYGRALQLNRGYTRAAEALASLAA